MDLDNYDKGIIKLSLNPKETDEGITVLHLQSVIWNHLMNTTGC